MITRSVWRSFEASHLVVLHHSRNYLVVDKPYDLLINKVDPQEDGNVTVHLLLKTRFPHLCDDRVQFGFRFVHRLDYSTSGALCVALNQTAAREAMLAFAKRRTSKYYLAVLRGHVISRGVMEVTDWVGGDSRPGFSHRMCTADSPMCVNAKRALTRLLILQRGLYDQTPATKVLLRPVTGRRHQIRVHCHSLGHPVVGDYTYSDRHDTDPHRMLLHAFRLIIPTSTEVIDVTTRDPFEQFDVARKWLPIETIHTMDDPTVYDKLSFV